MSAQRRTPRLALLFAGLVVAFVLADWWRGSPAHDRFAEPDPWALGSGKSSAAAGAHCAAPLRK